MEYTEKKGSALTSALARNNTNEFQEKFAEFGGEYISTKVREESIAEKILDVRKVDENHQQVQRDLNSDTFYWYEDIEQDAIAMEVAMRADAKPRWVDGKVYTIPIGKIETESVKKTKMELRVAKNVVKFMNENNTDAIRRTQDSVFMRTVRAGIEINKNAIGVTPGQYQTYSGAKEWMTGAVKQDLVNLMQTINGRELIPYRWLMSTTAYNAFLGMDAGAIGDLAGTMLSEGYSKDILNMPVVKTVKATLSDPMIADAGRNFFDYNDGNGHIYSDIYLFTEPKYLGRLIKVDDDAIWSEWRKDVFEWSSWRYCGLGFGDIRGIAMLRVRLQ